MSDNSTDRFSAEEGLSSMDGRGAKERWLTLPSIGISLALVGVLAYFLPYLYMKLDLKVLSGGYLPLIAVFPFLVLLMLNGLCRKIGLGLSRGEITVVLCTLMVTLSTLVTTVMVFTSLPSPVFKANPSNKFDSVFLWSIDERLMPYSYEDKQAAARLGQWEESINWYYQGIPKPLPADADTKEKVSTGADATTQPAAANAGYDPDALKIPWERWIYKQKVASDASSSEKWLGASWYGWNGPLIWWMIILTLFIVMQFCMTALLRRQWVDHEKLLFPHAEMIEATTEPGANGIPGGKILGNRLMWFGLGFAMFVFILEGLHVYWPAIPGIDFKEDLTFAKVFTTHPWSSLPKGIDLHLFALAIAFMLPSEISLSIWVFVLVDFAVKLNLVAGGATYHTTEPVCGYLVNGGSDQVVGMTIFILVLLFGARRHFAGVLKKAFLMGKDIDDSEEPLPYFGAFWGMVFSALGILVWCYVMGMSVFLSILIFGLLIISVLFLTRVVCELGIVTGSFQEPTMPQYLLAGTLGYHAKAGAMVTKAGSTSFWNRILFMTPTYSTWAFLWPGLYYGIHVMPLAMTSERLFRHGKSRRRFTAFLMLLTIAVTLIFALRSISIPYETEGGQLKQGRHTKASHTFDNCLKRDFIMAEKIHKPLYAPTTWGAVSGAVVMTALLVLRHMFYWWPLHPIGYIAAGLSGGVWVSIFVGWFIKRAVLKYGGGRLFRTVIPLFVGLLIGHFLIAGAWAIIGQVMEAHEPLEAMYSAIWLGPNGR
jgi:uncharacterized protein DUF6785/uncharacterized protein DUF6784